MLVCVIEKKCKTYMISNLKVPPWALVLRWGRQLNMNPSEIVDVSNKLVLRHKLGNSDMSGDIPFRVLTMVMQDPILVRLVIPKRGNGPPHPQTVVCITPKGT